MPEFTAIFSVEAAGQVYNQTNEFVYFEGNLHHNADLFLSRSIGAYATHGVASGSTTSNCAPDLASPRGQNPDAKGRGTRDNAVRLRHMEPARVPLQHAEV